MTTAARNLLADTVRMSGRVHGFLHPGYADPLWTQPRRIEGGARFERLILVGGQAALGPDGAVLHSGRRDAQIDEAMARIWRVVERLDGRPADLVKLVVFHTGRGVEDERTIRERIARHISAGAAPVLSLVALPRLWVPGLDVVIKAVALDGSDGAAPISCVPGRDGPFSEGLRCGEMAFVAAQTARDGNGALRPEADMVGQARMTIASIASVLDGLGCDLDDVVKLNTWYVGQGTDADWRRAAEVRSSAFRFPGPGATGVPVPAPYPDGTLIRQECLALRGMDGERLPRALSWPLGHWDWPMRVSFQQGIKVGRLVVLGGQYSMDEQGLAVAPDDMARQRSNTLSFIERILRGFETGLDDLVEATGFYRLDRSDGRLPLEAGDFPGGGVPLTQVPLATMGLEGVTLEVEGFAIAPLAGPRPAQRNGRTP